MPTVQSIAFTGAYRDLVTFAYPLGNGYRWYLPGRMGFNAADSLSPFDVGGVNPYVYCASDPINRSDLSGHYSIEPIANWVVRSLFSRIGDRADDEALAAAHARSDAISSSGATRRAIEGGGARGPVSILKRRGLGDTFRWIRRGRRTKQVHFESAEAAVRSIDEEGAMANGVSGGAAFVDESGDAASSNWYIEHYLQLAEGMLAEADGELGKIENLLRADKPRPIDRFTRLDGVQHELPQGARKAYRQGLIDVYRNRATRFMDAASQYHNYALTIIEDTDVSMDALFERVASRHARLGRRLLRL